jgi:hypothetical protein
MIILRDHSSQTVILQRKRVLEDVAAVLDIIPSFLVDRTGHLVRFDASVSGGRYGSGFDRGVLHFVVFEY